MIKTMKKNEISLIGGKTNMPCPLKRHGICAKTFLNYPPHPPMPAFRHSVQAGHILVGYQLPERSDTSGN